MNGKLILVVIVNDSEVVVEIFMWLLVYIDRGYVVGYVFVNRS